MRLPLVFTVLASYSTASSLFNEIENRQLVADLTRDPNANIADLQDAVLKMLLNGIPELGSETDHLDECRFGRTESDGYAPNLTTDDVFSTETDPSMAIINAFISSFNQEVDSTRSPVFTETSEIARRVENQVDSISATTEEA